MKTESSTSDSVWAILFPLATKPLHAVDQRVDGIAVALRQPTAFASAHAV